MNKNLVIITILCVALIIFGIVMTTMGILKFSTIVVEHGFHSDILEEERSLIMYFPPGYNLRFSERYPVLYMLDGEVFFKEKKEESKALWSMKKTLDRLIKGGQIEPLIVVGIYSSDKRVDEYTPTVNAELAQGGQLADYARFITEEVQPFINLKYRTLKDAEHTAIAGSSLGGLAALTMGLEQQDVYTKIGALAPALWWNAPENVQQLVEGKPLADGTRLWLDAGTATDSLQIAKPAGESALEIERFVEAVVAQDPSSKEKILFSKTAADPDPETDLDRRLAEMLLYLFAKH